MNSTNTYISVFTSFTGNLNKTITRDDAGDLQKTAGATLYSGECKKFEIASDTPLEHLKYIMEQLKPNNALGLGIADFETVEVVTGDVDGVNLITRSKEHIKFTDNKTLFYIDIDDSSYPIDETIERFFTLLPEFGDVSYLSKVSSSGSIKGYDSSSYHLWFLADNGHSIQNLKELITSRCWLNGYGTFNISKNGGLLERNKLGIDVAVFSPERLIFEANATLEGDLELKDNAIKIITKERNVVCLSSLGTAEKYELIRDTAKNDLKDERKSKIDEYVKNNGLPAAAKKTLESGILPRDVLIQFDNGTTVRVEDLKQEHDNLTMICPTDDKNRANKAIYYWNNGHGVIHSFLAGTLKLQGAAIRRKAVVEKRTKPTKRHTLEAARQLNDKTIENFINRDGKLKILLCPEAGSGKTHSLALQITERIDTFKGDLYFMTKELRNEFLQLVRSNLAPKEKHKASWFINVLKSKKDYCYHPDKEKNEFKSLGTKGCLECPFFNDCEHVDSWKSKKPIRLKVHAHLGCNASSLDYYSKEYAIMKNVSTEFFYEMGADAITQRYSVDSDTFDVMIERDKKDLYFEHEATDIEQNRAVIIDEYCGKAVYKKTRIYEDLAHKHMKNFINIGVVNKIGLRKELSILLDDKTQHRNEIGIYNAILTDSPFVKTFKTTNDNFVVLSTLEMNENIRNADKLLILDASTTGEQYSNLLGFEWDNVLNVNVQHDDSVTVLQDFSARHTKGTLHKNDVLNTQIKNIFKQHPNEKIALISYSSELDKIEENAGVVFNTKRYFFNSTGINNIVDENNNVLVVAGRPQLPDYELEILAMAHGVSNMNYEWRELEIEVAGGLSVITTTRFYEAKIVNDLYEIHTRNELYQVINRLRLLQPSENGNKKYCYILTTAGHNVVLDTVMTDDTHILKTYLLDNNCLELKRNIVMKALDVKEHTAIEYIKNADVVEVSVKNARSRRTVQRFVTQAHYVITNDDLRSGFVLI